MRLSASGKELKCDINQLLATVDRGAAASQMRAVNERDLVASAAPARRTPIHPRRDAVQTAQGGQAAPGDVVAPMREMLYGGLAHVAAVIIAGCAAVVLAPVMLCVWLYGEILMRVKREKGKV